MGDAIKDNLASRMSSLLGLPLANVKMLVPLVDESECARLMELDDASFMTESTKAIAAAQQRSLQGGGGDAPASGGAGLAAPPREKPKLSLKPKMPKKPELAETMPSAPSPVPAPEPEPKEPATAEPPKAKASLQLKPKGGAAPGQEGEKPKSLQLKPKGEGGDRGKTLQLKPKGETAAAAAPLQLKPKMSGDGKAKSSTLQLKPKAPIDDNEQASVPTMQMRRREAPAEPEAPAPPPLEPPKEGAKRRLSLAPKAPAAPPPPPPPGLEEAPPPPPPPVPDGDGPPAAPTPEDAPPPPPNEGDPDAVKDDKTLHSLDPRKTRAKRKAAKKKKMMMIAGGGGGGIAFLVIAIFIYNLFIATPEESDAQAALVEATRNSNARDARSERDGGGDASTDPADGGGDVADGGNGDETNTDPVPSDDIVLPVAIIKMVEEKLGSEARDQMLAEWAGKSRDERIAELVKMGLWDDEIPAGAQAIIDKPKAPKKRPKPKPKPTVDTANPDAPKTAAQPVAPSGAQLVSAFKTALEARDLNQLTDLVARAPKAVNTVGPDGQMALHLAARFGDDRLVRALISAGANLKARDQDGNTPLHAACMNPTGDRSAAMSLIDAGADIAAQDNFKATPLHTSAAYGQFSITRLLITKGADVNALDLQGITPLHVAENREVAQLLLAADAGADVRDNAGNAPIHRAAISGRPEVIELLVEQGTDPNLLDRTLATPLHLAVSNNRPEVLNLLLRLNASPLLKNEAGETALALAVRLRADAGTIIDPVKRALAGEKPLEQQETIEPRRMLASGGMKLSDKTSRIHSAVALYYPQRRQLHLIAFPIQLSAEDEKKILAGRLTEAEQILHGKEKPEGWDEIPYLSIVLGVPPGRSSYSAGDCKVQSIRYHEFSGPGSVLDLGNRVAAFSKLESLSAGDLSSGSGLDLSIASQSKSHRQRCLVRAKLLVVRID